MEILNITNGDFFNDYFLSQSGGAAVPFCEVMMDGKTVAAIYSEEFISLRSQQLHVSEKEYRSKMQVYDVFNDKNIRFSELHLWFGKDTFCQMNLLTLLAYLEQIGYDGKILWNAIDDETFKILEKDIPITLGLYQRLYEEILIEKHQPQALGVLDENAIRLYFDYHDNDGILSRMVKENPHMDDMQLICLLLRESVAYGLSDLQAEQLIKKHRQKKRM